MGGADEQVGGFKQLIDAVGRLISVQRNARVFLESLPVAAPSRSSDDVECCARKSPHAERADDICRRCEILAWFHGAQGDQPERSGLHVQFLARPRRQAKHVADGWPIERHFGVGTAMRGELPPVSPELARKRG